MVGEQLSIFDILAEMSKTPKVAVSLLDKQEYEVRDPEPWMTALLPNAEYCFSLAGMYTMVLCAARKKVSEDMKFCHYKVGDKVYSATGVGIERDTEEDTEEEYC